MKPATSVQAVSEEYVRHVCDEIFTELDMIFEGFQAEPASLEWKMWRAKWDGCAQNDRTFKRL